MLTLTYNKIEIIIINKKRPMVYKLHYWPNHILNIQYRNEGNYSDVTSGPTPVNVTEIDALSPAPAFTE